MEPGGDRDGDKFVEEVSVVTLPDESPDVSYLERTPEFYMADGIGREDAERYAAQNKKRLEAFYDAEWGMIGIRAEASVVVKDVIQKIRSGGLWGIESDSDERHKRGVANEELGQLDDMLGELGFKKKAMGLNEANLFF